MDSQLEAARKSRKRWMSRSLAFEQALRDIDFTLRCSAAEYVPAFQDVFIIIDRVQKKHRTDPDE